MPIYPFLLNPQPNFREYLVAESVILPHEINQINDLWNDEISTKAELEGRQKLNDELRKSCVIPITPGAKHDWIFERMTNIIEQANQLYTFNLYGFYEPLQLSEYGIGDFFDWHLDFGAGSSSNRKLSFTVQLSNPDEYEGGNLEFKINEKTVQMPRTPGTAIIFPSFIMHRVSKITKGTHRSIVGWVSGPSFK